MPQPAHLAKRIPQEQRRQILVMLARGDTKRSIAQVMGVTHNTVTNIERGNQELLDQMKDKVNTYRAQKATDILDKSENLIIRKLNKALEQPEDKISLDELSRMAKSSYERVRLEQGRATSISASDTTQPPQGSQIDLEQLVNALKNKDEIELQKIIFRESDAT